MSEKTKICAFVQRKIDALDGESPWSRAMLAKLRRGVGKEPGGVPDVFEITVGGISDEWRSKNGVPSFAETAVYITLTLYALHRQGKERTMSVSGEDEQGKPLGNSFGKAANRLVFLKPNSEQAVQRRFNAAATAADFTELAQHARGLIQLFKAEDITLDYPLFAWDLCLWQLPGGADAVRLRWGEDFYHVSRAETETNDKEEENDVR
jgi:CRISPR system Cascade subunit CasB